MIKIKEKELESILVKFNNIPIRISMYDCLFGNIEIKESKCEFIRKCNN